MSDIRKFMNIINEATVAKTAEPLDELFGLGKPKIPKEEEWPEGSTGAETAQYRQGEYADWEKTNPKIEAHADYKALVRMSYDMSTKKVTGDDYVRTYNAAHDLAFKISQDTGYRTGSIMRYAAEHYSYNRTKHIKG